MIQYLDAHESHKNLVIRREDDLRIRNRRVRHSCWLVCLVTRLIERETQRGHGAGPALWCPSPGKMCFHVQSVIVFTRPPTPPQSCKSPLLYISVKSTTLVIYSRCIVKMCAYCLMHNNIKCGCRAGPRRSGSSVLWKEQDSNAPPSLAGILTEISYVKLSSDRKKSTIIVTKQNVFEPRANTDSPSGTDTQARHAVCPRLRSLRPRLHQSEQNA